MPLPTMVLVFAATLSFTHLLQKHVPLYSQRSTRAFGSSFLFNRESGSVFPLAVACHAKKKPNFFDQILDYIEGGYFLDLLHSFLFLKSCFLFFLIGFPSSAYYLWFFWFIFRGSEIKEMVRCT